MSKTKQKKQNSSEVVTLIENPFGITTQEIIQAQNTLEELHLDEDLEDFTSAGNEDSEREHEELSSETQDQDTGQNLDDPHESEGESEEESEEFDEGSNEEWSEESSSEDSENSNDELELDANTEMVTPSEEETQADLDQLAQAIAAQLEKDQESAEEVIQEKDPEAILAAQIAEDQALEAELQAQERALQDASSEVAVQMDLHEIQSCLEAILFISDKPLSIERLRGLLGAHLDSSLMNDAIQAMQARYQAVHHGFELIEVAGGFQLRTKPGRSDLSKKLVRVQTQRLSSGSMETLAIVAYQQPVMKEEIDKIRGVDSSYFIRGLMDRKLIKISGRSELPGRPMLYSTTPEFLEVFGLKDLSSMPSLRELEQMIPHSQSGNPEDEDPKTKEMRRLVSEMKSDRTSALHYNPKEDELILKEIRDQVSAIPTSTPYLDELKAAEQLAIQQQKLMKEEAQAEETAESGLSKA